MRTERILSDRLSAALCTGLSLCRRKCTCCVCLGFQIRDGAKSCSCRCWCSWVVNSRADSAAAHIGVCNVDCRQVYYGNDKSRCGGNLQTFYGQISWSASAAIEVRSAALYIFETYLGLYEEVVQRCVFHFLD